MSLSSETTNQFIAVGSFILALVALIISIVALSGNSGNISPQVTLNIPSAYNDGSTVNGEDKVWLLHIGNTDTNIEYINEESGQVEGFNVDIINAVCRIANKNCRLVFDVYSNCWMNVAGETARGGHGLMAGWFDSCAAWPISKQRARTFRFGDPFSQPPAEVFVTLKDNPNGFDWHDLTNKKIGFIDASGVNSHCLATQDDVITVCLIP
ncbi:uncharacterized protein [Amphiura filiformis]|uniref:uncharacterized protein n=1 Tax=Amphiura filiformis TaxID=82378 RepID=UPI003B21C9DC